MTKLRQNLAFEVQVWNIVNHLCEEIFFSSIISTSQDLSVMLAGIGLFTKIRTNNKAESIKETACIYLRWLFAFQGCLDNQFTFSLLFFFKDPTSGHTQAECLSETSKFCAMAWREMDAASKQVRNSNKKSFW